MTKKSIHLSIAAFVFCILGVFFTHDSSALTYSSNVDVGFTFNPTISVNLSGDLLINNLAPGSVSDSNTINVTVATNASQGYVLTATSGTKTTNTDLVNQTNSAYKFTSIATNASLDNLTTDNTWGFSYSDNNGIEWSSYFGLPLDNDDEGATGVQLMSTSSASNASIQAKIGAKAGLDQAAGTYLNTINFYAVANPDPTLQPVSCPAGKICYNANSLTTVQGEMGQQTTINGASATLWASNFSRSGYGFAGWNDKFDYSGNYYGPNQDITAPADVQTNGLSLYAVWVKSAGSLQNWNGCSGLAQGAVTALTDARDNDTYAVAKLADGKCWMIENLRLENTGAHNTDGTLSQGYNSSFIGLADPESANFESSTTANSLYSTDGTTTATISGSYQDYRFPRYNNNNTNSRQSSSGYSASGNTYSMGNYYTWHAAIADTTYYSSGNHNTTSICPAGWHLPTGVATTGEFALLDIALGGTGSTSNSGTNPTGAVMSSRYRSYPNNFLYSGGFYGSWADNRGSYGVYWSSTASGISDSYYLVLGRSSAYPGTNNVGKNNGLAIRCTLGS